MTAHGFRALASTVLNEESGFDAEVIERQLAHKEIFVRSENLRQVSTYLR